MPRSVMPHQEWGGMQPTYVRDARKAATALDAAADHPCRVVVGRSLPRDAAVRR